MLAPVDPDVDAYIARSEKWPREIAALRPVLLSCGLSEEIKWGKPCYSHTGTNIVILQEMKDFLALMFFTGALLSDPAGVLEEQGPNSRAARRIRFTSVEEATRLAETVRSYVIEAVALRDSGAELPPPPELVLVDELRRRLDEDPALEAAFAALTPGRQREYHLYFSDAKKPETRAARIEKSIERILQGRGRRDR